MRLFPYISEFTFVLRHLDEGGIALLFIVVRLDFPPFLAAVSDSQVLRAGQAASIMLLSSATDQRVRPGNCHAGAPRHNPTISRRAARAVDPFLQRRRHVPHGFADAHAWDFPDLGFAP
jgi:hypothetical protein